MALWSKCLKKRKQILYGRAMKIVKMTLSRITRRATDGNASKIVVFRNTFKPGISTFYSKYFNIKTTIVK